VLVPAGSQTGIHERKLKPGSAGDGIRSSNADENHDSFFPEKAMSLFQNTSLDPFMDSGICPYLY
jgi:hypothetical protein